jgi:acyl-CoA synthetase (AMP-forming)/AMP-acid ligase II
MPTQGDFDRQVDACARALAARGFARGDRVAILSLKPRSGERAAYGFLGAALAARGITAVSPDYRLFPDVGFPAFVDDAALAYGWTAANLAAGQRRAPRRPMFVSGLSAGPYCR